jgi:hypothetical protein
MAQIFIDEFEQLAGRFRRPRSRARAKPSRHVLDARSSPLPQTRAYQNFYRTVIFRGLFRRWFTPYGLKERSFGHRKTTAAPFWCPA